MQTKHTPGPWAVTAVGSCFAIHPAASENERDDFCRLTPHNYHPCGWDAAKAETDANARLMAAAPELADALAWALDQIEDDLDLDHQEALAYARAVLARARGEGVQS